MVARTVTLLENFSSKIGLSLPSEIEDRIMAQLVLTEKLSVQFEEDNGGEVLWLYIAFPAEVEANHSIMEMLRILFAHHRHSDARLIIDPNSGQLLLASRFIISSLDNEMILVHGLEGQVRELVHIAQELFNLKT